MPNFKDILPNLHVLRQEITSYDEMCSKRRLDGLAWLQLKCTMIQGFGLMTTVYGKLVSLRDENVQVHVTYTHIS